MTIGGSMRRYQQVFCFSFVLILATVGVAVAQTPPTPTTATDTSTTTTGATGTPAPTSTSSLPRSLTDKDKEDIKKFFNDALVTSQDHPFSIKCSAVTGVCTPPAVFISAANV